MLDELTDWRLQLFMIDDELPVITPQDYEWEWVSASLPWIDPLKEAQANIMLVQANLESEIHLAKQQGREFQDIVNERQRAMQMMQKAGLQQVLKTDPALTTSLLTQPEGSRGP
jgi:capsid protein